MKETLILRASNGNALDKLIDELKTDRITCLVQSNQYQYYVEKHSEVKFVDIKSNSFYNLSSSVMDLILQKQYDDIYITLTGEKGFDYDNVLNIIEQLKWKKAYFYNCNGVKTEIKKNNRFLDFIISNYIKLCKLLF